MICTRVFALWPFAFYFKKKKTFGAVLLGFKSAAIFAPSNALGHGVMVTQQFLVLFFRVRVLVTQQSFPMKVGRLFFGKKST